MSNPRPNPARDEDDGQPEDGPPRRGALVALVVLAVLIVGGLWLSRTLHQTGRIQDCVMAGRNNCAPVGK